jgi:hypothetical protein
MRRSCSRATRAGRSTSTVPDREPETRRRTSRPRDVDIIAVTHGHRPRGRHGRALRAFRRRRSSARSSRRAGSAGKALVADQLPGLKEAAHRKLDDIRHARERVPSSARTTSIPWRSCGIVIRLERPRDLLAGDTCVFGDSLIARLPPRTAVLPINDHFTMGPREAAVASSCSEPTVRPLPLRHLPLLTGTPGSSGSKRRTPSTPNRAGRSSDASRSSTYDRRVRPRRRPVGRRDAVEFLAVGSVSRGPAPAWRDRDAGYASPRYPARRACAPRRGMTARRSWPS